MEGGALADQHRQDYVSKFQAVAELEGLMPTTTAAE